MIRSKWQYGRKACCTLFTKSENLNFFSNHNIYEQFLYDVELLMMIIRINLISLGYFLYSIIILL